jgi:hypothetical protein
VSGQNDAVATKKDRQAAAKLARRLLDAVARGELDAESPAARRLLRRIEGAVAAWEGEGSAAGAGSAGGGRLLEQSDDDADGV